MLGLGKFAGGLSLIPLGYAGYSSSSAPPEGSNFADLDFIPSDLEELKIAWLTSVAMVIVLLVYIGVEWYDERKKIRKLKSNKSVFFAKLVRQAMLNYAYSFGVLEVIVVIFVGMWQKSSVGMGFLQGAVYCGIFLGIVCWILGKIAGVPSSRNKASNRNNTNNRGYSHNSNNPDYQNADQRNS